MRKQLPLCLVAAALVSVGVLAILLPTQSLRAGITPENFDRIREGMTETEVEQILGGPSGRYTDRLIAVPMSGIMFRDWWIGDEGVVTIEFTLDAPRRVCHKEFAPIAPESLAERIRRKCHWLLPW
jgi:hypothetical protein